MNEKQDNWDNYLDVVMSSMQTDHQSSTKYSPFEVKKGIWFCKKGKMSRFCKKGEMILFFNGRNFYRNIFSEVQLAKTTSARNNFPSTKINPHKKNKTTYQTLLQQIFS